MKTFVKIDFYSQLFFLGVGALAALSEGILFFYFIVGIPQLISFLIRLFLPIKKSVFYIIYGILIIPVWVSILSAYTDYNISQFLDPILLASLFYSPVMAAIYIYDYNRVCKSYP
ncbi:hypothetical protein [Chryseobacterium sp.]|uniref:hypothetical protein n=1 Tax=Chryseobacterium sp. TaxID=1871047 RepID=UPI000ED8F77E|nr:hypothetical protein [Chryseobacterium sp.]HCA07736.1 hypothetical protein [Chryseobacterium sp.]